MKLISVLIKLLSSKSKLSSVFVLKLDNILSNLDNVVNNGGTLVLRIGLTDGEITVSDSVEKPTAEKKPAPKK
jgi:hypothetical protein